MDRQTQHNTRFIAQGAVLAALAAGLGLAGIYFAPLSILTNLVWTIPLVVVTMRWGLARGLMALLVAAVLMGMLSSPLDALFLLVEYGALALVYGYSFRAGHSMERTLLRGVLAAAVGSVALIVLAMGVLGFNPQDFLLEVQGIADSTVAFYEETGLIEQLESQGVDRTQIEQLSQRIADLMVTLIPGIMVVTAMLTALVSLLLTRSVLRRLRVPVPGRLPPFRTWRVDFRFVYGFIAGLACLALGDVLAVDILTTAGVNLLVAFGFVFAVQGLSVVVFLFGRTKTHPVMRIVLIVFLVFYLQAILYLMLFIGLFDLFFDYRKRLEKKEDRNEGDSE